LVLFAYRMMIELYRSGWLPACCRAEVPVIIGALSYTDDAQPVPQHGSGSEE
jgi:hypothetical protein